MIIDVELGLYKCSRCRQIFWKDEMCSGGYYEYCKLCHNQNERERRSRNRTKQRDYERSYYASNPEPAKERAIRNRANNPEKAAANDSLNYAIRAGKISRQPCVICGSSNSQGHHENYDKPLEVVWLCAECHRKLHYNLLQEEE